MQQPLHRQQHDVEFGPASIGLVTQRVTEEIFIPWARAWIHWIRFCHTFRRLHHNPVSSLIQRERARLLATPHALSPTAAETLSSQRSVPYHVVHPSRQP